jgi:hypothetical protein
MKLWLRKGLPESAASTAFDAECAAGREAATDTDVREGIESVSRG